MTTPSSFTIFPFLITALSNIPVLFNQQGKEIFYLNQNKMERGICCPYPNKTIYEQIHPSTYVIPGCALEIGVTLKNMLLLFHALLDG